MDGGLTGEEGGILSSKSWTFWLWIKKIKNSFISVACVFIFGNSFFTKVAVERYEIVFAPFKDGVKRVADPHGSASN